MAELHHSSDVDFEFGQNLKLDVAKIYDDRAVGQSIKNIVMGEHKPFRPFIFAGMGRILFSLLDGITISNIKDRIEVAVRNNEPRVGGMKIDVTEIPEKNYVNAKIQYTLKNSDRIYEINTVVEIIK